MFNGQFIIYNLQFMNLNFIIYSKMNDLIKYLISHLMYLVIVLLFSFNVNAQSERKLVRDWNKQYQSGKYSDAEINYRKSLEQNKSSYTGTYNLADGLYKQKKFD